MMNKLGSNISTTATQCIYNSFIKHVCSHRWHFGPSSFTPVSLNDFDWDTEDPYLLTEKKPNLHTGRVHNLIGRLFLMRHLFIWKPQFDKKKCTWWLSNQNFINELHTNSYCCTHLFNKEWQRQKINIKSEWIVEIFSVNLLCLGNTSILGNVVYIVLLTSRLT